MNLATKLAFAGLLLALTTSCSRSPSEPTTSSLKAPAELKAMVDKRLKSVKSYKATVQTVMHLDSFAAPTAAAPSEEQKKLSTMHTQVDIEAVLPDQMRLLAKAKLAGATSMEIDARFDGQDGWFALSLPAQQPGGKPQLQVVHADQKVAPPARPFDLGFNMQGFGLAEGEDLVGSVRWLLSRWSLTEVKPDTFDGKPCLHARGTVDVTAAIDDVFEREPQLAAQFAAGRAATGTAAADAETLAVAEEALMGRIGAVLGSMRDLDLYVTDEGDVLGWVLGRGTALVETKVSSWERNAVVPPTAFIPDAAMKAAARDVSEEIRAIHATPRADPQTVARLKQKVHAVIDAMPPR